MSYFSWSAVKKSRLALDWARRRLNQKPPAINIAAPTMGRASDSRGTGVAVPEVIPNASDPKPPLARIYDPEKDAVLPATS